MRTDLEIELGAMPMYWRVNEAVSIGHSMIPPRYAFRFESCAKTGLVTQATSPRLLEILERIYKEEHNVGYLQDGHMLSQRYGEDLLRFIFGQIAGLNVRKVMEIGCGGCYILERLAANGFDVMGIDPSPIAARKGLEKNIPIVPEFFLSAEIPGVFDLILQADVLEHVSDPAGFLMKQKAQLSKQGMIIISVPDCTASVELGDVSMALHQHLNYFSIDSLAEVVRAAGLEVMAIEAAKYGGSLYCCAKQSSQAASVEDPSDVATRIPSEFFENASRKLVEFRKLLEKLASERKTVGFYVPLRAVPYLGHLSSFSRYRFFDDTPHWHQKYIDGLDAPIENFRDLLENPVDELFIMSLTFGGVIQQKVADAGFTGRITTLPHFLGGTAF
jgi:2-polyprenyl-3-methyl-5-hydroxy-6-metoxy-1,4-benzoquinol methylase